MCYGTIKEIQGASQWWQSFELDIEDAIRRSPGRQLRKAEGDIPSQSLESSTHGWEGLKVEFKAKDFSSKELYQIRKLDLDLTVNYHLFIGTMVERMPGTVITPSVFIL